jgi:predicted transcriptional regulator
MNANMKSPYSSWQGINRSIQQETIICLECGKSLQLLSHRHLAIHGLTPRTYKCKHGLHLTQSLCTHALVRRREALAKSLLAQDGGAERA